MPSQDASNRAIRLTQLERLLFEQPQRKWRTSEIASYFAVSEDTAFRDLQDLSGRGTPPLVTEGSTANFTWQVSPDACATLPPLRLGYAQGAALYAAARLLSQQQDERNDAVRSALIALISVLPPAVRADHFTADGLVSQLRGLSMQAIVAEDKKKSAQYGFTSPTLTVKLTAPAGSQSIVIGKKDGDKYDAGNSALQPVFTLNSDFLTQFQKDPADMRDKDLFSFSTFETKRLEVDSPKGHLVFEKQKDKWKQTAPALKDLTNDKVETLLDRLRGLRAESFPKQTSLAALGLTKPAFRFQVQSGEKNQTQTVEAAKVADHVYARRSTDRLASELSKTALDDIEKALSQP